MKRLFSLLIVALAIAIAAPQAYASRWSAKDLQRRESDGTYSVCIRYAYLRKPLADALTQQLLQQLEQENPALKAKVQEIFNNN